MIQENSTDSEEECVVVKDRKPREIVPTVLLLISDLEFGGAQRQVIELANSMPPERFHVHVCTLADYVPLATSLRDRDRRLHHVPKQHKFDFSVVPKLARLMRRLNVDVVHTFLFDAEFFGRLAGRLAGVAAIIGSERNTNYMPLRRHVYAYALTRCWNDLMIANSSAGASFHARTFNVPRSKFRVVHNGVDVHRFKPRASARGASGLAISNGQPVIGMFASFKPQKNHAQLLRALPVVIRQFPALRVLFVGDELFLGMSGSVEYKREVDRLIDELGLRKHCLFLGNREDVENIYPLCDLTVLPSFFEGTPNVVLESMASGVPVVVTDVSDNALLVPEGKAGFVVPLDDTALLATRICTLLGDPALRGKMSEAARAWVLEEFTGKRLAEKTAAVYDEALRSKAVKALAAEVPAP